METDLKIEREWRQSLQDALMKDREANAELKLKIESLRRQKEV